MCRLSNWPQAFASVSPHHKRRYANDSAIRVRNLFYCNREVGQTWYNDSSDASSGTDAQGTESFAYDMNGGMSEADNSAVPAGGDSLASVADYAYTYTITGNMQTQDIALGAMSKQVTVAAAYDYNNNITLWAANINTGGVTANFNSTAGYFESSTGGGTDDFQNSYYYDKLGEMTAVEQFAQTPADDSTSANSVASKAVGIYYNADERPTEEFMYQAASGTTDFTSDDEVAHVNYSYDDDSELTGLTYKDADNNLLAGYHWDYSAPGIASDEYSYADTSNTTDRTSFYGTWAYTTYTYDRDAELTAASYSNFATSPTPPSDFSTEYDSNGNQDSATPPSGTSTTTGEDNRLLFDGTYTYSYDAEGNRTAKWIDNNDAPEGSPQSGDTDITVYTWNNANDLTSATHYNNWTDYDAGSTSYDGEYLALVLNSSGQVTERELTGPAADQVFASEYASITSEGPGGGQAAGPVSWYLTDPQGTVRDVVRGVLSGSAMTAEVVDHVIYTAFGAASQGAGFSSTPLGRNAV